MAEFDPTIPVSGTEAEAAPIRSNFFQLAIHHAGATAPSTVFQGYIWLDTADAGNHKLKIYDNSAWRTLFEHCESTPVPAAGGGSGISFASPVVKTTDLAYGPTPSLRAETQFVLRFATPSGGVFRTTSGSVESDGIVESGPTVISDPSNIVASAVFGDIVSSSVTVRRLLVNWNNGNIPIAPTTAQAVIQWVWNGVTYEYTYNVSKSS